MRNLDETDLEIIRLLIADSRRPLRDIADHVDLSPPAISDRVQRLEEQGIIRRFTVDIDRGKLTNRSPVLIELRAIPGRQQQLFEEVRDADGVQHAFKIFDGSIVAHATVSDRELDTWLGSRITLDHVQHYDVRLVDRYEWQPGVSAADFSLACVVCGNPVTEEGVTDRIDGTIQTFCCPSCEAKFKDRYRAHKREAERSTIE